MTTLPKVLVTRPDYPAEAIALLKERYDVEQYTDSETIPRDIFLRLATGKTALFITVTDRIDSELLNAAGPTLKCVSTMSVGYDHIELDECKKRGIKVGNTPSVSTTTVAEFTVALLFAAARKVLESNRAVRNGQWTEAMMPSGWMFGVDIASSIVGIVGMGRIGLAVAKRIQAFEPTRLLYYDIHKVDTADAVGATYTSFKDLLNRSDFVIVCCALVPETTGLFDENAFANMKPNAIFVNTSRGGVVKQQALCDALINDQIRGAAIDVCTPEPLPKDHALVKLENCVLTPHLGSATYRCRLNLAKLAVENIFAVLNNKKMPAEVIE